MNFFQTLAPIASQVELQINVQAAKDGSLTIMLTPKAAVKDPAIGVLKPIVISGTPDELDRDFFTVIWQPLEKTAGIVSNIAEFENASEKLDKENAAAKAQLEVEKNKREAAKKKFDDLTGKAKLAHDAKDYKKAIDLYTEAVNYAEKPEAVQKIITDIKAEASQGSMFGL